MPPRAPDPKPEGAPPDSPEVLARVKSGLALVEIVARQIGRQLPRSIDLDSLVSYGREGLLQAARTYEASYGVPFERWANIRVRGAVLDGVRASGTLPRRLYKVLRALEASTRVAETLGEEDAAAAPADAERADERLNDYLSSLATAIAIGLLAPSREGEVEDPGPSAEDQVGRRELLEAVRGAIAGRPEAERHLLQRHYFDDVSLDDAGREIGLSKSWASRLHARAIEGVMRELKRSKVR